MMMLPRFFPCATWMRALATSELCRRELKRGGTDVPTIVVSAVRVSQSRLEEFHPLAYLPKPFPIDALLRLVVGSRTRALDESPDEE